MVQPAFKDIKLLAITADPNPGKLPDGVVHLTWPKVFSWLKDNETVAPVWTEHLREYMRQLESRFCAEGYGMRGPIVLDRPPKSLVLTHNAGSIQSNKRTRNIIASYFKGPATFAKDLENY